jgi:hypothetical protein
MASDNRLSTAEEVKSNIGKESQASIPIKLDEPQKPRPRDQKDEIQRWRQIVQEELQRRREAGEQDTPVNSPLDMLSSSNGTEKVSLMDQNSDTKMDLDVETAAMPDTSATSPTSGGDSKGAEVGGVRAEADKVNDTTEVSAAEVNGTKEGMTLAKLKILPLIETSDVDPMAPRGSIVPPPIKGMNKTVFVDERPKSLAW